MSVRVGRIREIWRYPVKGMAGEQVQSSQIDANGIAGDRLWAVRDTAREEIQSCKFRPQLLQCTAHYEDLAKSIDIRIRFPGGEAFGSSDPLIHQTLSKLLGHASTLNSLPANPDNSFFRRYKPDAYRWLEELKATFTREPGEPLPDLEGLPLVAQDHVTVPGSFFLVAPIHIITTSSLKHLKTLLPESDWDVRRFRPNILIDCEDGMEGFVEQAWVDQCLIINGIELVCTETAPRCGAVTRAQEDLVVDKQILRTIVREAEQNVGIYGSTESRGRLSVGDAVYLESATSGH